MRMLALAAVCALFPVAGRAATPEDVLGAMGKKMAGCKDYTVTTTSDVRMKGPQGEKRAKSASKVICKGIKRYTETTGTDAAGKKMDRVQVFDGKTSWDYDKSAGTVKRVDLETVDKDIQEKLKKAQDPTNLGFLGTAKYAMEEKTEEGRRCYVLTSKKPVALGNQSFDRVVFRIDSATSLPARIEMTSAMKIPISSGGELNLSTTAVQEFKNWKLDTGIPDYQFALSLPEGVTVVDETPRVGELYRTYMQREEEKKKAEKTPSAKEEARKPEKKVEGAK